MIDMDQMFLGETGPVMFTVALLVVWEIIKGLVAKGLGVRDAIEQAKWQEGVTNSLATLITLTEHVRKDLDAHIKSDTHSTTMSRRL